MRLPNGIERIRWSTARGWVVPDARPWVEGLLTRWGTLARGAEHESDAVVMHGRGPVRAIPGPDGRGRVAIRRYLRGGMVSKFARDAYLRVGYFRPVLEMYASAVARERGVPTPRVVAALAYPGTLTYRGEIASEYVPDSDDLAGILFHDRWPGADRPAGIEERHAMLFEAGRSVALLAAAGIHHRDLNAKNLLVQHTADGPHTFVLDFDRARLRPGPIAPGVMAARLERSLRKFEADTGRAISDAGWEAFREGIEETP